MRDLVLFLWGELVVNLLRKLLPAVVGHVRPDNLLLGEAEEPQTSALQGVVKYVP